jgi:hypothetical protein
MTFNHIRTTILYTTILFCCHFFAFQSAAQIISGKITTEQNEPVPYATIFVEEAKEGTISNADGDFRIQLNPGSYHIHIRSLGYIQAEKEIQLTTDSIILNIVLKQQEFEIKEVKIFPGKEDPAYFIIRKAITKARFYREKIKHYEADLYIKSNFSFTNIPKIYQNRVEIEGKKLKEFFKENVTYVIESQNKITFDYPNSYHQKVISKKSSLVGFDEPPVMELMTTSFYEERPNQVISPLSSLALKHYNFQYEGFITVGYFDVFKIKVTPKRKSDELVEGYIYIVDKLWCIYNLDFSSNFEFFKYRIKQQFENLGNENWLPVSHNINGTVGMLGLRGMFYYGASVKYDSIVDNNLSGKQLNLTGKTILPDSAKVRQQSKKEKTLNNEVEQITAKEELTNSDVKKVARLNRKILKEQYKDSTISTSRYNNYNIDETKDSIITSISWDTIRAIPLTPAEIQSYQMADSLVSLEKMEIDTISGNKKKKGKSTFSKIVFGDYDLCKDSLVRLGYDGLISIENYDWNTVDGFKYKQKLNLRLNPDSGKYITITPEIGYAFSRKAIFGSLTTQFRNVVGKHNTLGFTFGKESRDFKPSPLGISPGLNSISSWFFAKNYMKLYETEFIKLNFSQKIKKNFNLFSSVAYNHFSPLKNNVSYLLSDKKEYSPNIPKGFTIESPELQQQKSFSYSIGANYRKRLYKPWLDESPFLFLSDFYSIALFYKQGLKNVYSSVSDFSQIDFNFHQQANISPSSGIDWKVNAGYFFNSNQMHFSQFKHFNTSEILVPFKTFTHNFQLLNDYEFSTSGSYVNVGIEFKSEYLILRYLSFLNKRTWSESIHFNYLETPDLSNYWEAGYSLNSLFFVGNIGVFTGFKGGKFESVAVKFSISGFD